ncbi:MULTISPECIES: maleylacetoacetate isomerase [Cobetia]|uniref:Maleylacetoacetate isomerase n=1 Tax=Cobetia crustatorum TaxID=553385 RepID=A0A558HEH7_9GAMM|nr:MULTISPECIES: maleylacetoacetate isomerase [Cobetia]TVU67522.1 maleylacetoacetate isomerase [Cobetia crustatorum]
MTLHGYYRSSTSYRVRIALNLKGIAVDQVPVNLLEAEQRSEAYLALNPQGLVPTLMVDEAGQRTALSQSLAIMEYLEERWPTPALLPDDLLARAQVRSMCLLLACEMHPLNNPRVLKFLTGQMGASEEQRLVWYRHWVAEGFLRLEKMLTTSAGRFCFGDTPGMADACLMPQVYNARRFECDLAAYPRILAIEAACHELEAFQAAQPDQQADSPAA